MIRLLFYVCSVIALTSTLGISPRAEGLSSHASSGLDKAITVILQAIRSPQKNDSDDNDPLGLRIQPQPKFQLADNAAFAFSFARSHFSDTAHPIRAPPTLRS